MKKNNRLSELTGKFGGFIFIISVWFIFCLPYFTRGLLPIPTDYLVTFFPPWSAQYGMPVKNNAMPDVITQIFPWKTVTIESWKNGEVPLWNPYSFSGTKHAANYQTAVFSPVNFLYWIFPFEDAWSLAVLGQPLLTGIFMFMYLRSVNLDRISAVLGSLAIMFSGFMVVWMAYATLGWAVCFLPLALYASEEFLVSGKWKYGTLLSAALCLSLLSGHFQISLYVCLFTVLYGIYRSRGIIPETRRWMISGYAVLGIALAAPQLLLTYRAYSESVRSQSFINTEIIPWNFLITLVAPDFFGNPVTRNSGTIHYAEWSSYIGTMPFLMAILAIFTNRNKLLRFFITAALISLLLATPSPLVNLLYMIKLPVLSTSAASRIIVLFSFSLSVLAALGISRFLNFTRGEIRSTIRILLPVLFITAGIWLVLLVFPVSPKDSILTARRNFILPTVIIGLFSVILLAALKINRRVWLGLAVIVISAFELLRFAGKWMPFERREFLYPQTGVVKFLTENSEHYRLTGNLFNEVGSVYKLQLIEGYDALYQARYGEFINAASDGNITQGERSVVNFDKLGKYRDTALRLLGVKYVIHRISDVKNSWAFPYWEYKDDRMKLAYRDQHYEVYEYQDVLPRVFLASAYRVISDKHEIIRQLYSDTFPVENTLILEKPPDITPQAGDGVAEILHLTSNSVTVKTDSNVPKLLFLSDVYDSGWQVYINGKSAEIYRADYDFRAVGIPAGSHLVQFQYRPGEFILGLWISGVALTVLAGLGFYTAYANRHR